MTIHGLNDVRKEVGGPSNDIGGCSNRMGSLSGSCHLTLSLKANQISLLLHLLNQQVYTRQNPMNPKYLILFDQ